jgi:hypothetical protein
VLTAHAYAHPQAIWISDSNTRAKLVNDEFLLKLVSEGGTITRLIADHKPARGHLSRLDLATRVRLYEVKGEPRYLVCLELCVGSGVLIWGKNSSKKLWSPLTKNLFTKPGELSRGLMADLVPSISSDSFLISGYRKNDKKMITSDKFLISAHAQNNKKIIRKR